ncbi:hypothetical protein IWW40_000636 [Coemansia sp. RSA 1250]|nr:hypothetical protein IWW40_000636 [Coemansia sp. RSA 1250]
MRQEQKPHSAAAATRARNYALQAHTVTPVTQRGLRRNRSSEASPERQEPAHVVGGSLRRAPRIGVAGRQQSEPVSQPPARRLRTTPSTSDLRSQATPQPKRRTAVPGGGSLGRTSRMISPGTARMQRRPLPSPHFISTTETSGQVTHIPRLAPQISDPSSFTPKSVNIHEMYQGCRRQLEMERQTNQQLISDIHKINSVCDVQALELERERVRAADALARADAAENELARLRNINRALEDRAAAMQRVVRTQTRQRSASSASSQSDADDCHDWNATYTRMVSRIGSIRDTCAAEATPAAPDSMRAVDEFLATAHARKAAPSSAQRRFRQAEDARIDRRRSTMLFADLVRPSRPAAPGSPNTAQCERCDQLVETLHAVEIDNDYYREANARLRDTVSDVVSRHNAMVRAFERERQRRRDRRAQQMADASHNAARDRARASTLQHGPVTDADDLAQRFSRAVHIA